MREPALPKLLPVAMAAVLGLAACSGGGNGGTATPSLPSPVAERPSSSAKLALVEPESGAVLGPDVVRVRLELTGAKLTKQVSRNLRPDEGHMHLRLDGETITLLGPDDVRVRLDLTGAKLTKEVSRNLRPDEGHIHLRLDGETITLLGDLDENLADIPGTPVSPGPHLLEAEFVAADHGPFNPRIIVSVPFTVE